MATDGIRARISSLRLSTGGGLTASAANGELEKLMECPVCQEIPLPPIFTCVTGHAICNDCRPKLKECVICKSPYTQSRNFALESMIQAAKFYCDNRPKGCSVIGTLEELFQHAQNCTFSLPIQCYRMGSHSCKEAQLFMVDYVDHLKNVHNLRTLNHTKDKANAFTESYKLQGWGEETLVSNRTWKDCILNYDGKVFTTRVFSRGPLFYFRCMFIGETVDAAKYAVKITIQKTTTSRVPKCVLTAMVASVREVVGANDSLPYTVVHRDLLENLGKYTPGCLDVGRESPAALSWNVRYEIITL